MALLTPTDMFHNIGRTRRVDFTIQGPPPKRPRPARSHRHR
jgi:hypothetical protein